MIEFFKEGHNLQAWDWLKYRSGTVNSKSFVGKVLLRIKWNFELTVFELTVPDL